MKVIVPEGKTVLQVCVELAFQRRAAKLAKKREARAKKANPKRPPGLGYPPLVCRMLHAAKARAKKNGQPFALTHAAIVVPETCPILGHVLEQSVTGVATHNSPSLDKINPELGYVPGNVRVISHEANRLKDANTIATLERLLAYCRGEI